MTRVILVGALATTIVLFAISTYYLRPERDVDPASATSPASPSSTAATHEGLLYGRVNAVGGAVYEGRLRWGGHEEALWSNTFNGTKDENPWVAYAPPVRSTGVFGIVRERPVDGTRPFMARFGDIERIQPGRDDIRVTLKSGSEFVLDRYSADDLADGLRVWDASHGVVDLHERQIRAIDFLPAPGDGSAPYPLHGTVRTRGGEFTGLIQWNREACLGSDELLGGSAEGELRVRFDTIRSIARRSPDSSLVTLRDGREIELSGTREVGSGNRGVYVDDPRYGRVLVSWEAFERVDLSPGGTGPAYDDFGVGRPLAGSVATRSGRRLTGRLVYDLDESETTETLDAPWEGVDYTIPFGLVASIVLPADEERGARHARVTLNNGEELLLEPAGDLGEGNAGMLIFLDGRDRPEYVPWTDVERVDFDRPPATARNPD